MNELFDEKLKVVLGLIRTNNTAADAKAIAEAVASLVGAQATYQQLTKAPTEQTPDSKVPKKQNAA